MSFLAYDLTFLVVFGIFLTIFLYKRKKKIQREGILILYRTQIGVRAINYIAKKWKRCLNAFEYVVIVVGYGLMISMLLLLFQLIQWFLRPEFVQAVKIPPLMPLIPYIPSIFKIDFLPPLYFTYWIVVLAITAICHEFFHGIFARARDIKIKSTGFAFIGPFVGAFVEPDEAKVKKLKIREQLGFLTAGTFANVLVTIVFFLLMWLFFISAFSPAGVVFNTYMFSGINVSAIDDMGREFAVNFDGIMNLTEIDVDGERYFVDEENMEIIRDGEGYILAYHDTPALRAGLAGVIIDIDGKQIRHSKDLEHVLGEEKPGTKVKIKTLLNDSIKEYDLELAEHPQDETKAYLGIAFLRGSDSGLLGKLRSNIVFFKDPNTYYKPAVAENLMIFIYNLLWWIVLINLSVGLVNMLPIGIFDGGRVFFLTVLGLTKSEKVAKKAFRFSTMLLLFVFLLLTYLWFVNFFFR